MIFTDINGQTWQDVLICRKCEFQTNDTDLGHCPQDGATLIETSIPFKLSPGQLKEAEMWIYDSFEDAPAEISPGLVMKVISLQYDGGIGQFAHDTASLA